VRHVIYPRISGDDDDDAVTSTLGSRAPALPTTANEDEEARWSWKDYTLGRKAKRRRRKSRRSMASRLGSKIVLVAIHG
jgi:hypothetical protein